MASASSCCSVGRGARARFKRVAYWTDEPPAGQDDATPLETLNKVYAMGLENLKKVVENQ